MLSNTQRDSLNRFGYLKVSQFYDKEHLSSLKSEFEEMIKLYYNKEELGRHSVYPSDSSDARISHAMMISEGESSFPKVDHTPFPQIKEFLKSQNLLLADLSGQTVSGACRSLLNYQSYFSGSKPVGEHFDGEYLQADKQTDGIEFSLLEGILPRFVGVLVVENENDGKGVQLIDHNYNHVYSPKLNPGDLVLFDNINLRHRVPTMEKPRISIGLRNFDHMPLHFARNESHFLPGADYRRIPEGYVSENADCFGRFTKYMESEWPKIKESYTSYV